MVGRLSGRANRLGDRIAELEADVQDDDISPVVEHYERCALVLANLALKRPREEAIRNMVAGGVLQSDAERYHSIGYIAARDELMVADIAAS